MCRERYSQLLSADIVTANSSCVVFGVRLYERLSKGWDGVVLCWEGGSRARYLTVSVVYQKKAADYTYPMGIGRWNPTSCSSSDVALGIRKTTEGVYSRQTQMRM